MAKNKDEPVFEDGKEIEEYANDPSLVDTLNSLEIPGESSPEATQRFEDVALAPVRNEKAKPLPPVIQPAPKVVPVIQPTPKAQPLIEVPMTIPKIVPVAQPIPKIIPTPIVMPEKPTVNYVASEIQNSVDLPPPPVDAPVVSQRPSLDGMIQKGLLQKKQQLFDKAQKDYEDTEVRFYDNLFNMINMAANNSVPQQQVVQPVIQGQSIPQVQSMGSDATDDVIEELKEEVRVIGDKILDSRNTEDVRALQLARKVLQKQISKLDGTYVEPPDIADYDDVPEKKLSNSAKVVKPPKEKGRGMSPKVGAALVGLFLVTGVAIVLLINQFIH